MDKEINEPKADKEKMHAELLEINNRIKAWNEKYVPLKYGLEFSNTEHKVIVLYTELKVFQDLGGCLPPYSS